MIYNDPMLFAKKSKTVKISITGAGSAMLCRVTIDGSVYISATTLIVESGTVMTATAPNVKVNGVWVFAGNYDYVVRSDITVVLTMDPSDFKSSTLNIIETPE